LKYNRQYEKVVLKDQGYGEAILRFLRSVLLMDTIFAVMVGIISLLLDLHTLEAYGTLLVWAGAAVILFGIMIAMGGYSSRLEDVGAFNISRAGNMSENLRRVAEAGQSSLGCFSLLLVAGLALVVIGYMLQIIPTLFGYVLMLIEKGMIHALRNYPATLC
jgi:hypothetical protein